MKVIKISAVLVAAAMATGCASMRENDAQARAAWYKAKERSQLISEDATLDRADAAMQTFSFTDSGGKPMTLNIQGNYNESIAPDISAPPSEVQAAYALADTAIEVGIPAGVVLYEGRQTRKLEWARIKEEQKTRRVQIESNERIAINRDDLIRDIAANAVTPLLGGEALSGYPCAIRSGVLESDFVSGSISDGIDEDGSSGLPCVDYADPEPEPEPEPEPAV